MWAGQGRTVSVATSGRPTTQGRFRSVQVVRLSGFQGLPPAKTQNSVPRNSPCQPGRREAPSLRGQDAPICESWSRKGDKDCPRKAPPSGPDAFLRVRWEAVGEGDSCTGKRCPKSGKRFFPLSTSRVRPGPRSLARSGGASSQETMLSASGGRRCASLRVRAHRCSSAGASPRAPSPSALGGRRPRPLSPAPAAACLCCFLSLALPPSACSSRACPEVKSPSPRRIARTCSGPGSYAGVHRPPQVAESRAENAPAPPPPAPSPGCGGRGSRRAAAVAAAASGRGWDATSRALALRTSGSSWRRADSGMESCAPGVGFERCSRGGAPVSPVPVAPGRLAGLPGPQPRAAQLGRLASGPALRPAWPARAASSWSCRPSSAARCTAPARLTGAGARCRRCVSPPTRPPRHSPISCSREAVTTVTRIRVLGEAGPGAATRAFRGKIQRPAGRLSNLFTQAGARRGLLLKDCNFRHAARLRWEKGVPSGSARHAGSCSLSVEDIGLKSSIIY